jgi:hypothetical protein
MATEQRQDTRTSGSAAGGLAPKARPALDPRVPVLVQPFKGLVENGVIAEISVVFSSMGTEVKGKASKRLADVKDSGLNTTDFFPVGRLLEIAEMGEDPLLKRPGKKGKGKGTGPAQVKPARSLCSDDFSLAPAALQTRANEIAKNCGGGPLVGRVRSAGRFSGTSTVSYREWWDAADGDLRALSLSEGKRYAAFTPEQKALLVGLQCPFRGTLEFTVKEDDEDEE